MMNENRCSLAELIYLSTVTLCSCLWFPWLNIDSFYKWYFSGHPGSSQCLLVTPQKSSTCPLPNPIHTTPYLQLYFSKLKWRRLISLMKIHTAPALPSFFSLQGLFYSIELPSFPGEGWRSWSLCLSQVENASLGHKSCLSQLLLSSW